MTRLLTQKISLMIKDKYITIFHKRKFLNTLEKGTALIYSLLQKHVSPEYLSKEQKKKGKKPGPPRWYYIVELQLSDCNRTISLDVGIDENRRSQKNSIRKLDILIDTLIEFKNKLSKEIILYNNYKKENKIHESRFS